VPPGQLVKPLAECGGNPDAPRPHAGRFIGGNDV
jgi:hypothetical protein